MWSPLLGACAHLERDVDLTHWLVHAAWLRRRFESVREQVGLQRKRTGREALQRIDVGDLQLHQGSLGDEDLRVSRSHLLVFLGVHLIRLLRLRYHLVLVAVDRGLREGIVLDDACRSLPQKEPHALHFAFRPLSISLSRGNVSLVAVENGNPQPHVGKTLQSHGFPARRGQQLAILLHATAKLQVGNGFPLFPDQGCFGSFDAQFGDSYGWTLVDELLHQFIRIDRRSVLEFSFELHQGKPRIPHDGRQCFPNPLLVLFGHGDRELCLLRFHFRFAHVGSVRLADIRELMGGLDSVVGKLAEVLPQLQRLLDSQRLDVEHPYVRDDSQCLLLRLSFRLFELLIKNLSIQAELSTQHEVLLKEKALLATVKRPASDLFALVADGGVRVEPGLFLPAFRRSDVGGRLRERGVVLQGHLLQFFECNRLLLGSWSLRSARQGEQEQSPGKAEYESGYTTEW